MALARVQYVQQVAGNRTFVVSFPYLSRDHVKVSVSGNPAAYSWLSPNTINLATAPAVGEIIDILRETERDTLLVDFQDASTITEQQLDLAARQSFFLAQEAFDATGGTMAVAKDGSYSASGRRISNLADPDSDDDAVSQGWVKAQYNSGKDAHQERVAAEAARTAASASQEAAATSAASALISRGSAEEHSQAAGQSRAASAASQAAARSSEVAAAASATAAASSEGSVAANARAASTSAAGAQDARSKAESSAQRAWTHELNAFRWATAPAGEELIPGKYSAYHYAAGSVSSAQSAASSAESAKDSASSARGDASSASTYAQQAASYRDTAGTHRVAAGASAQKAKTSADQAASYASGLNLPGVAGGAGKRLRVRGDEQGYELAPVSWGEIADKTPNLRNITISQSNPSGGADGDVWIKF